MIDQLMTTAQAAKECGTSDRNIRYLVEKGTLVDRAPQGARNHLFLKEDVLRVKRTLKRNNQQLKIQLGT